MLWGLAVHRYALQRVIDALWELDKVPKKSQAHQLFYPLLRSYGFRAHVARNIYTTALALVESVKENRGSKPVVRRMTARLDYQDAKVDTNNGVVRIIIRNKWYVLRFKHRKEYIKRFRGLKWKEVHVRYWRDKLHVSVIFETKYVPQIPKEVLAIDINLKQVTIYDGSSVRRYEMRFIDALSKKARAEGLQKKYPERWRYNNRILKNSKNKVST